MNLITTNEHTYRIISQEQLFLGGRSKYMSSRTGLPSVTVSKTELGRSLQIHLKFPIWKSFLNMSSKKDY